MKRLSLKNIFLKFIRRIISILLKYSISYKFSDILLWPVSKRIFKNYSEIVEIKKGVLIRVYGDMADMVNKTILFTSGYAKLAWEPVTARLAELLSADHSCAVVAGAHIGYYPIILSKTNPKMTVYAFEPNPLVFERLAENLALNNLSNVKAEKRALGDSKEEKMMIFDSGQSTLADSFRNFDSRGVVPVTTADYFFKDKDVLPDLMIFDAEGYELNILKGAESVIRKSGPDIIFEINPKALANSGSSQKELCDFLREKGYHIFIINDNYSHRIFNPALGGKTLENYNGVFHSKISFVNAFATLHPDKYKNL